MSRRGPSLAEADPDRAVSYLDFCDAWAFCSWAGKRLCGYRGIDLRGVDIVDRNTKDDPDWDDEDAWTRRQYERSIRGPNEWIYACSQGGRSTSPFEERDPDGVCLDDWKWRAGGDRALRVRDTSGNECHGTHPPYDRVFDMAGGVRQWTNACRSADGLCSTHGGLVGGMITPCEDFLMLRMRNASAGVRCCADAVPGYADRQ